MDSRLPRGRIAAGGVVWCLGTGPTFAETDYLVDTKNQGLLLT